jgi:hypothetical protein
MTNTEDPLLFKQLTVTISYGVTRDVQVGATIPIHLVTLGPSFEGSKNSVQQVKLVFAKSKSAKDPKAEGKQIEPSLKGIIFCDDVLTNSVSDSASAFVNTGESSSLLSRPCFDSFPSVTETANAV